MAISSNTTGLRPGVCTSTTRPTAPYEGQTIYETDTDKVLIYNGSAWYPNWNSAWGVVGVSTATATTSFSAGTALTVLSNSPTIVAGRRYLITGRIGIQITGAATAPNALFVSETTLGSKTLAYETQAVSQFFCKMFSGQLYATASDFGVTSGTASKTIDLKWKCAASGALNLDPDGYVAASSLPQQLIIEDIGPS
jgi:hypothetical protein